MKEVITARHFAVVYALVQQTPILVAQHCAVAVVKTTLVCWVVHKGVVLAVGDSDQDTEDGSHGDTPRCQVTGIIALLGPLHLDLNINHTTDKPVRN